MRTTCFIQAYNEELFIKHYLQFIYPLVDSIVITEGCLSPTLFRNAMLEGRKPHGSTDETAQIIQAFPDPESKMLKLPAVLPKMMPRDREQFEGLNKNWMLDQAIQHGYVENGDLIIIGDCDEFWHPERFLNIVERFRSNEKLEHVPIEEHQFAYGLRWCFDAEHNGRFMRYVEGAKFGNTNHFIYPDGRDITKDYTHLAKRIDTGMVHLCWAKSPQLIREKVVSFKRQSFTNWYNYVYLVWPFSSAQAYFNNSSIPPHRGRGFAEGQHAKLKEYQGALPVALMSLSDMNWIPYIWQNVEELHI